jgi:hypothetical protein
MTAAYKRFTDGYQFQQTEDGTTGQEIYIQHDEAAGAVPLASLPVVGSSALLDPSGSAIASCKCRTKAARYVGSDPDTAQYTFTYSTTKGKIEVGIDTNDAARRYSLCAESIMVKVDNGSAGSGWTWIGSGAKVDQDLALQIVTGAFTLPAGPYLSAANNTFWTGCLAAAGKINSSTFEHFRKGSVLFEGVTGATSYDATGSLQYTYELNFRWKYITSGLFTGTVDDYQYLWNADSGAFDKPVYNPGSIFLYGTADLSSLAT